MAAATETTTPLSASEILNKAAKSAVRGGTAGALAMGANVGCLMWMRTTVRTRLYQIFCVVFEISKTGKD